MLKNTIRKFCKRRKIFCAIILTVIFLFVAVLGLMLSSGIPKVDPVESYDGDNKFITFDERTLVAAHRVGRGIAPENTFYALKNCFTAPNFRADILEFDLHLTADERLILLHDDTLDRTSNAVEYFGHKNVYPHEKTYAQLRELNMGENFETLDGDFPFRGLRGNDIPYDLRIVSLIEVLHFLRTEPYRNYDFQYIIEIKDSDELGERAMDLLYQAMIEFDIVDKVVIGSFNQCVIDYIDDNYPNIARSAGMSEVFDFYFSAVFNADLSKKDYKFQVLQIPYKQFGINFGKKSIVDYAHHYGLAMQFWTINKESHMRHLVDIGADAMITDYPDLAYKITHNN